MALSLSFLGRSGDRWRVRVDAPAGSQTRGLTIGLVSAMGRPLGPAVVGPVDFETWVADLRGPNQLPTDAHVRATMDGPDGHLVEEFLPLQARRGVHAWLHADGNLALASKPRPSTLSRKETTRLSRVFSWLCPCPSQKAAHTACPDDLASLLADFDVDASELDEDLVARMRRS